MRKSYYVNKNAQNNGDHEVHDENCLYLPAMPNRMFVGVFANCKDAVSVAKISYPAADGCKACLPGCHTR